MFYEEIRIKQSLSYISFCPLRVLHNSKFILITTSLGTNAVVTTAFVPKEVVIKMQVVTRIEFHCIPHAEWRAGVQRPYSLTHQITKHTLFTLSIRIDMP